MSIYIILGGINAETFRNRKGYFSLNVLTICDSELKIRDIVARWPGSSHDQTIFNNIYIKARFDSREFGHNALVGDSGFAGSPYLIIPLRNPVAPYEQLYREALVHTRNVVERSYGVLKRRFPILAKGIAMNIDRIQAIVVACAVLHNIAIEANETLPDDEVENIDHLVAEGDVMLPQQNNNYGLILEQYLNYFRGVNNN